MQDLQFWQRCLGLEKDTRKALKNEMFTLYESKDIS